MPTKKPVRSSKNSPKKASATRKKAREVRIRMYKQGLGDCFLLTFPGKSKPFHMLIDCGALKSKHYGEKEMQDVVAAIQLATGGGKGKAKGRLDIVAATHEHWDHISGFLQAKKLFDDIKVNNVWVAWTEEPENAAAQRLKKEFKKKKKAVQKALALLPSGQQSDARMGLYRHAISELSGFFGMGAPKGMTTDAAWKYILSLGRNVYCDPKKRPLELSGVEGVRVYVLGPPEDPDFVRKTLSKKETYDEATRGLTLADSFLAAVSDPNDPDNELPDAKERSFPFDGRYRIPEADARRSQFFLDHYGFDEIDNKAGKWRRINHEWLTVAGELALHLDSYTNNTCLAIAIELVESGQVLLFPGDAQVGNWLSWGELSWEVTGIDGKMQTVKIEDLLKRTVFYKVGHHGSHNATLREKGLERMIDPNLVAMIPVHRPTADDQEWKFPYPPLWKALKEKARGRVLLADAPDVTEIEDEAKKMLTDHEWSKFSKATEFKDLYVEYRIPY
ncbi:MAG TPA: hypothetical protein VE135_19320 [Pyrinomonadaceae bacterium]|nr:hypothetical protein [Pyrinomonadaceae bacterium]